MNSTQMTTEKSHILYDADCLGQVDDTFFEPQAWAEEQLVLDVAPGRGTTIFVQNGNSVYALRHYQRGGIPARFSRDRYLWLGLERSRAWQEWHLLSMLYQRDLPVPRPVAARVIRHGMTYQADIVTERLPASPLAEWLGRKRLSAVWLQAIGTGIRQFHDEGIYHADLNARNILLDDDGGVYLIDFDRGEQRKPSARWQRANLERLKRSLEKFRRTERNFAFDDEDWKAILRGYEGKS